ncbi:hypothetical protein DPMN_100224 [Dreissena polymorpha]|uniref:Uncharacterized protein n=1 Tax=Dreissena polymorpha TaxID=45954 RepID=A0A9D4LH40_DREPO|nr:hypothetical protein DPMN_100224 [Dreissena polymorpha]
MPEKPLKQFHKDWTKKKSALSPDNHFHEDWTINVSSIVLTIFEPSQDILPTRTITPTFFCQPGQSLLHNFDSTAKRNDGYAVKVVPIPARYESSFARSRTRDTQRSEVGYSLYPHPWLRLGDTSRPRDWQEIRHFCGMLDGHAFLPVDDVASRMAYLKQSTPDILTSVVDYFDATYASAFDRPILRFAVESKLLRSDCPG